MRKSAGIALWSVSVALLALWLGELLVAIVGSAVTERLVPLFPQLGVTFLLAGATLWVLQVGKLRRYLAVFLVSVLAFTVVVGGAFYTSMKRRPNYFCNTVNIYTTSDEAEKTIQKLDLRDTAELTLAWPGEASCVWTPFTPERSVQRVEFPIMYIVSLGKVMAS